MFKQQFFSLFPEEETCIAIGLLDRYINEHTIYGKVLNQELCDYINFTGKYEMPVVEPIECDAPRSIIAFYRIKETLPYDCAGHFFTKDSNFESTWTKPFKMLENIRRCPLIISPDFSVYTNLVYPQKIWNIYRNRLLAAWWQYNGCRVIPNVSWLYGVDYAISFDGWPKHSVIAVNSIGVKDNKRCEKMWLEGYNIMLETLQPNRILRYGAKIPGEREDISTYYPNDNRKFGNHGW